VPESWAVGGRVIIPTVSDRVVQAALKNILEPVFEADFYRTSYR
jgi:RNA-directed DNA polymerase